MPMARIESLKVQTSIHQKIEMKSCSTGMFSDDGKCTYVAGRKKEAPLPRP